MQGLNKRLPPFSTDISGACSALFELGGIVVVHEPGCCTSCYTTYDEPRYYGSDSPLYSSELREIHLTTGDDETILRRIESAAKIMDSEFIAIIGSPLPRFVGTDYKALASEIEKRTGLPAFSVDAGGFEWYDKGASKALLQLAKKFVTSKSTDDSHQADNKKMKRLNIIGAVSINGIKMEGRGGLMEYLHNENFSVISVLSEGSSIKEIAGAANADLNMVVSVSGLETAQYLLNRFGTPYSCRVPVGLGPGKTAAYDLNIESALIIGDQIISNSIRDCLLRDFGIKKTAVSSFFSMDNSLMQPNDIRLDSEDELEALLGGMNFDVVIGDPAFIRFTENHPAMHHISIPHTAVSGFSPLRPVPDLIGEKGFGFLRGAFERIKCDKITKKH